MAGKKLTENDKKGLNDFLESVKDSLISTITPEILKDGIKNIKIANANGDQKISHNEAMSYLAANFNNQPPDSISKENIEYSCNMLALHTHISKPENIIAKEGALIAFSGEFMGNAGITKEIADFLKSPEKKRQLADKFTNVAQYIADDSISVPSELKKEVSGFIAPKVQDIGKGVIQSIEVLLQANPDIKRDLLSLPDTSGMDITADHICQALLPKADTKYTKQTISKR